MPELTRRSLPLLVLGVPHVGGGVCLFLWAARAVLHSDGTGEGWLALLALLFAVFLCGLGAQALLACRGVARLPPKRYRTRLAVLVTLAALPWASVLLLVR